MSATLGLIKLGIICSSQNQANMHKLVDTHTILVALILAETHPLFVARRERKERKIKQKEAEELKG